MLLVSMLLSQCWLLNKGKPYIYLSINPTSFLLKSYNYNLNCYLQTTFPSSKARYGKKTMVYLRVTSDVVSVNSHEMSETVRHEDRAESDCHHPVDISLYYTMFQQTRQHGALR